MANDIPVSEVIETATKKMEAVVARWFQNDPILLGVWCLLDKKADPRQKTMGIDSRTILPSITYNPYFVNSLTPEYLEAVMVSEGFKLLLKHPTTRLQNPKAIARIASQVTINEILTPKFADKNLFSNGVDSSNFNLENDGWFEYYFKELMENLPKTLDTLSAKFGKDIKEGDADSQGEGKGEGKDSEPKFEKFNNKNSAMKEYFDPTSTSCQDWEVNDLLDSQVKQMVDEKKGSSKNWGTYTGDAINIIVAAHEPKISYKDIIRRFHKSIIATKQVPTRMKLNRRYGLTMPGHRRVYKSKLILAIDASGSISDEDLAEAFAIVNSLCKHTMIEYLLFDTEIKFVEKKFKKARSDFKVHGRGGTNFQQVIDYAEKSSSDGLIIFTDGCADKPTEPKNTRVLWLMTSESEKPPVSWGMVAKLNRMENIH